MKRFEVSTEIGSLSVTYQKQKKVLVCLNGAGLLPSYENFSLILEKPPPTIGYLTIDFPNTGRSPIHDQAGKNLDNLADAVYEVLEELGISEYILSESKGNGAIAGLVIGLSLMAMILVGLKITGLSVNPARSLAPAVLVGGAALQQVWIFILAPIAGGVLAALVAKNFLGTEE
ncbi:aquaporin [Streptococcus pneumoniae]|uniref:aquaporin n=1 Tax=Streptococcus pneumoniae TaxID=1313 RepID=UPI00061C6116|nr:alpha/beta fold family hydrolase [Streptococcus pneumoniae]